eukprot:7494832-Heterocapsa_arctica.AAC.1
MGLSPPLALSIKATQLYMAWASKMILSFLEESCWTRRTTSSLRPMVLANTGPTTSLAEVEKCLALQSLIGLPEGLHGSSGPLSNCGEEDRPPGSESASAKETHARSPP